jgi:FKBP-type peptidyl-prolyl cis-trans isomerase
VHCTGYGKNKDLAVPFWSTKDAGQQPFEFVIGQGNVIKAWDEGVATMKVISCHVDKLYIFTCLFVQCAGLLLLQRAAV